MTTATKRRLVRALSQFKIGQRVRVDGDYNGDYHGVVVAKHRAIKKPRSSHSPGVETHPGVTVRVDRWEGNTYQGDDRFEVLAWDEETRLEVTK